MEISFTTLGVPTPQGSMKAFMPKGAKHPVVTTDNKKLKPWRQEVAGCAINAMAGIPPTDGAVELAVRFYFQKPKSTPKRVTEMITKPDVDKLIRGICDALKGIVYRDDSQVVFKAGSKEFGTPPRAEIELKLYGAQQKKLT
jgi:Holliday junction resolvase RusA-like endonuclease